MSSMLISHWPGGLHRVQAQPAVGVSQGEITWCAHQTYQQVEGFGGAFTRAAALLWKELSPEMQQRVMTLYFDREQGAGYSLCRVPMAGCDFAERPYTYADTPGDMQMEHFSIADDLDVTIPMIRSAQALAGNLRLHACPWSPPAWMKDTGHLEHGGRLLPEYYDAMARYFVRFLDEYKAQGIPIWVLTAQNEPNECLRWPTCLYSAQQEAAFVGDHLIPALEKAGYGDVKLMIWDNNKDLLWERVQATMGAITRPEKVWGAAFHWYAGDHFDQMDQVQASYPDLHLVMTECCTALHPEREEKYPGQRYAHEMIGDFLHGACGYIDWNLLLDEQGGPSYVANQCVAPITACADGNIRLNDAYDAMFHFAHYVRPGARRMQTACPAPLETVGFINPDAKAVLVLLNPSESDCTITIGSERWMLPPHSMGTWTE